MKMKTKYLAWLGAVLFVLGIVAPQTIASGVLSWNAISIVLGVGFFFYAWGKTKGKIL